jgi:hypothetical protein
MYPDKQHDRVHRNQDDHVPGKSDIMTSYWHTVIYHGSPDDRHYDQERHDEDGLSDMSNQQRDYNSDDGSQFVEEVDPPYQQPLRRLHRHLSPQPDTPEPPPRTPSRASQYGNFDPEALSDNEGPVYGRKRAISDSAPTGNTPKALKLEGFNEQSMAKLGEYPNDIQEIIRVAGDLIEVRMMVENPFPDTPTLDIWITEAWATACKHLKNKYEYTAVLHKMVCHCSFLSSESIPANYTTIACQTSEPFPKPSED